jgi:NAD(P)-dependent dehydrogenase (short-subunit alcohol dehydrogenase family)
MTAHGRFEGKIALITGGAGDIGLATATRLGEEGATIALLDVKEDALSKAQQRLSKKGISSQIYRCDVTEYQEVRRTVESIVSEFGAIDLLFNNAGYQGVFEPLPNYPADDFAKVIEINLIGAFHVLQVVSGHMMDRRFGRIVNTASMAGVDGPPNMAGYGASKFAIIGLTQTAAKDLAPYNVRVNAISPGFMGPGYMWDRQVELQAKAGSQYFSTDPKEVAQQMIGSVPMRRYGNIEEIPGTVAYLFSEDSSYTTGVNIRISGGIM